MNGGRHFAGRRASFAGAVALAALTVGCTKSNAAIANGDDPLRALMVPVRSDRYNVTYWTQKSIADTALWAPAVAYCEAKTEGDHPNCDAVRQVRMLERMSRMPAPAQDNFSLRVHPDTQSHATRRR